MRTYTLLCSILAHVCAACAVLFTTVLATDELPTPHEASTFVSVVTVAPPNVPPPPHPAAARPAPANAAPVAAPEGFTPEVDRVITPDFDTVPSSVVSGFGGETPFVRDDPPPPPPVPVSTGPLRVGGVISAPAKIVHVSPTYPALARSAGISGIVILETTIAEDGTVRDVRVLRSEPLLEQAAIDAVRQWRFTPTLLNGHPVAVLMTVTVSFTLR